MTGPARHAEQRAQDPPVGESESTHRAHTTHSTIAFLTHHSIIIYNMPIITWEEKYNVSIQKIDSQHQKLVSIINNLYDAMVSGKGHDILKTVLSELLDYTDYHFKEEETYMDKFKFIKYNEHKKEHLQFIEKMNNFKADFEDEKVLVSMQLLNYLKEWLICHICEVDKEYVECFKENGIE